MKKDIHPQYGDVTIRCACGATHSTRSTIQGDMQVDLCSSCHPFFTGKQKFMDTAGRIDRLKKKFGSKVALGSTKGQKPAPSPRSIREKLREAAQQKTEKTEAQE